MKGYKVEYHGGNVYVVIEVTEEVVDSFPTRYQAEAEAERLNKRLEDD